MNETHITGTIKRQTTVTGSIQHVSEPVFEESSEIENNSEDQIIEHHIVGNLIPESSLKGSIQVINDDKGVLEHNELSHRNVKDCHPMKAITGLNETFSSVEFEITQKQDFMLPLSVLEIYDICTL